MDKLTVLRQVLNNISPIEDETWEEVSKHWEEVCFKKGEFLTREGQTEQYMYIVFEGVQRAYALRDGSEVCVAFSFGFSFSGIPESFLTQTPSLYYLQAISDSVLLRISYDNLQRMYDKYKSVERMGRIAAEQLLARLARRQIFLIAHSAEERYRRLLTESPQTLQLIPQKYLASYLGMTPETFSRLRRSVKL